MLVLVVFPPGFMVALKTLPQGGFPVETLQAARTPVVGVGTRAVRHLLAGVLSTSVQRSYLAGLSPV